MKKTNIILSFVICILSYGCTDLSETVYTGVAMNDFFKNEKELVANAGRAYTKLQGYNSEQSLWTLLLQASDECAVPACGGSWYSNGRYEEIQTNKIPPANKLLTRDGTGYLMVLLHVMKLFTKRNYHLSSLKEKRRL